MYYLFTKISGVPYPVSKQVCHEVGLRKWVERIIDETKEYQHAAGPCRLRVTFLLPPNLFPKRAVGLALAELLTPFLDALSKTIFKQGDGKTSSLASIEVTKVHVSSKKEAGAIFEVFPLSSRKVTETHSLEIPHFSINGDLVTIGTQTYTVPARPGKEMDDFCNWATAQTGKFANSSTSTVEQAGRFLTVLEGFIESRS